MEDNPKKEGERFNQPRLRLVKSPWESALETGSVEAAFQEVHPLLPPRGYIVAPTPTTLEKIIRAKTPIPSDTQNTQQSPKNIPKPLGRDVYKNKNPKGWSPNQRMDESQSYGAPERNQKPPKWLNMTIQDYSNMRTYNTAARGWAPKMDYYRPVVVNENQKTQGSYTDF